MLGQLKSKQSNQQDPRNSETPGLPRNAGFLIGNTNLQKRTGCGAGETERAPLVGSLGTSECSKVSAVTQRPMISSLDLSIVFINMKDRTKRFLGTSSASVVRTKLVLVRAPRFLLATRITGSPHKCYLSSANFQTPESETSGPMLNVQCLELPANDFTEWEWAVSGAHSVSKGREASLHGWPWRP